MSKIAKEMPVWTTWSEGREETRKEVEAEKEERRQRKKLRLKHRQFMAKVLWAARSVEEDFSICSENDGQIGVDKLFRVALVLGLCSA